MVPRHPDVDGRLALPPNQVGREQALALCRRAAPDRVHVFDLENHAGTPVYVHAKVCVIDDVWASVGSDNFNRRSWTHDSELSCAVLDDTRDEREPADPAGLGDGARVFARDLRLRLWREHLDRDPDGTRTPTCSTRPTRWRRSPPRPTRCRAGTTAAGRARGRRAGCGRTDPSGCPGHPGLGAAGVPAGLRPRRPPLRARRAGTW